MAAAAAPAGGGFEFVLHGPDNGKFSKEVQTKIRKQAMKAVGAARRKSGKYGKHNLRQYPEGGDTDPKKAGKRNGRDGDSGSGSGSSNGGGSTTNQQRTAVLPLSPTSLSSSSSDSSPPARQLLRPLGYALGPPSPMPLSGIDGLMGDHQIDPIDFSALTAIHIGAIASTVFSTEPNMLAGLLSCRQWSYFDHVPSRYGHCDVLDDALRCLVTMAHSMLVPAYRPSQKTILSHYGKALNSLQSAVDDAKLRYRPEVLCATSLLALFELLNTCTVQTWSCHIAGASRLIQLRGPSRFTTEFDKALFMALLYPLCCEAFLNDQMCFLEDPAWHVVFESTIIPGECFTDRSELGIELAKIMATLPGNAQRVGKIIMDAALEAEGEEAEGAASGAETGSGEKPQPILEREEVKEMIALIRASHTTLQAWRGRFNETVVRADEEMARRGGRSRARNGGEGAAITTIGAEDYGKRFELLGTCLIVEALVCRLLSSVCPDERERFEDAVLGLAHEIKALEAAAAAPGSAAGTPRVRFFLHQKSRIADATLCTSHCYREVLHSGRVVEPWRFQRWCGFIRKRCSRDPRNAMLRFRGVR